MNFLILGLLAILSVSSQAAQPQQAVVIVPVADVWSRPIATGEKPADELRETQVLLGEKVLIHESSGTWALIEAIEQPEFTHHNRWEGYPGWVLANAVKPTHFSAESKKTIGRPYLQESDKSLEAPGLIHLEHIIPDDILTFSKKTIGTPYLWGGLDVDRGLDCSGLVHLAYRLQGIEIPRDSFEQWMKAKPLKRSLLNPADLIFSAKAENPKKITHVALYAGDGWIIEAPQMGMAVRKVSFKEKYGKELKDVESGDHVGDRYIYFGSFLQ